MSQNFDDLFDSAKKKGDDPAPDQSSNPYASSGGGPSYGGGPQFGGSQYGGPPQSSLAMTSMVLGILGAITAVPSFCCCAISLPIPMICSVAGIACGFMSLQEINRGEKKGKELAMAGIITGFVGLALALLFGLLMVFGMAAQGFNAGPRRVRF